MILFLSFLILAPLLGGLCAGLERKFIARLQGRHGPPVWQPYWDVGKLLLKRTSNTSHLQDFTLYGYGLFLLASAWFLLAGGDMLMFVFMLGFAQLGLIITAVIPRSPFSFFGALRELWLNFTVQGVLWLATLALYLQQGSFIITRERLAHSTPLIMDLPLIFMTLLMAFAMVTRKSPCDFAASPGAHQELVSGILTELSGPQLAVAAIAQWYETMLFLYLLSLFWVAPWFMGVFLAMGVYAAVVVLDHVMPRMTCSWMLKVVVPGAVFLAVINVIGLKF